MRPTSFSTGSKKMVSLPTDAIQFVEPALRGKKPEDLLFPTWCQDTSYHKLKTACKRLNLPRVGMHDLRHMCESRFGPALAQAVLGHKDISTTVDMYGHLTAAYLGI